MYKIVYRKPAQKALAALPQDVGRHFLSAFEQLADGLNTMGLDIRPLEGRKGFRLRISGWRAIYHIMNDRLLIEVVKIGSRGDTAFLISESYF